MRVRKHAMRHLVARAISTCWAIDPEKLDAICELLTIRRAGLEYDADEIALRIGPAQTTPRATPTGTGSPISGPSRVAVLTIAGTLVPRRIDATQVSGGGLVSAESIGNAIDEHLANPDVSAIVLDIASPGGAVQGIPELAAKIRAGSKQKRIIAVANQQMTSAAYWLASGASEIVASPSAEVGSIGILAIHQENSRANAEAGITTTVFRSVPFKAELSSLEPLSDAASSYVEQRIAAAHQQFVEAIAAGRRITVEAVASRFGQGRTLTASAALAAGMVDRIATLDQVLSELTSGGDSPTRGKPAITGATAAAPALSRVMESVNMDPRLLTALIRLGALEVGANEEQARAALSAVCALRGLSATMDVGELAAALVKPVAPPATPPVVTTAVAPPPITPPVSPPVNPLPVGGISAGDITSIVRCSSLSAEQQLVVLGELIPQAGSLTIPQVVQRVNRDSSTAAPPAGPRVTVTQAEQDTLALAARDSLLQRHWQSGAPQKIWDNAAQAYVDWKPTAQSYELSSLPRLASRLLVNAGIPINRILALPTATICRIVMGADPRHFGLTADGDGIYNTRGLFTNLLYDAANVVLRNSMLDAPITFKAWMKQGQALRDFRFVHKVIGGELPSPQVIPENGEFQETTFTDGREPYRLTVWGERFSVSWQTLVDDNLGAFTDIPQKQGRAMIRHQNKLAYQAVKDNAALTNDGIAYFDASTHKNYTSSGTALSVASLNVAKKLMREQVGLQPGVFVGHEPRWLLTPPAIEGTAAQLLTSIADPASSNANVNNIWRNRLELIVDPELGAQSASNGSDTAWYAFTDWKDVEHFEFAYLEGMETPAFESMPSFETLGIAFRVYCPFAVKGIEYRGGYKNVGA